MKKLLIAASLVAAGLAYGPAHAQTPLDFAQVDADHSGSVSMSELKTADPQITEAQFKTADANGDGSLDQQEFATLSPSASNSPVAPGTGATATGSSGSQQQGTPSPAPGDKGTSK
jgi:hypothetical protein